MCPAAPLPPVRSVSVLMPTWQGAEFLERSLAALAAQETDFAWDFLAVDSGSTDDTLAILARAAEDFPVPLRVRSIDQVEFDHGDTRNQLAAWSTGDLLVFLTQDAIPEGSDWLTTLAANFADDQVAAVTCRNVPRPDAEPLTRLLSERDPGYARERREVVLPPADEYDALSPHEKRLLFNFNDVASAVRRSVWERHPFPRTWFGEDVLMARALLEAGWKVVYDADATVEHSHDYDAEETRARARIDGRFNAEWLDRICVGSKSDARALTERIAAEDIALLRERRAELGVSEPELPALEREVRELRRAAFEGLYEGGRTEVRLPATGVLEDRPLHVLFVVHGFPPDTWAGTEIYTLNLAKALEARGHRCTVMTRVGDDLPVDRGGLPDFTVTEAEFEGLRVLRLTHRLQHGSLRESYQQPRAEAAFRKVLAAERPDVVHFQHLIHSSAGLVEVAREFGAATVLHCHDYWALCARVQLIRPDGERCPKNMGAGCLVCVKEQNLDHVPRLERLGRVAAPLLDALAQGGRRLGSERSRRRWEGWADMADRHEFVTDAYAAADLRISPSRFLRALHVDTAGFDPHTFLFSDNGMRTDHIDALEKTPDPEGRLRFGFVGTLAWYKGGETLVRAMLELVKRRGANVPAVLNVYGGFDPRTDDHHRELAELAAEAGDRIQFRGRFDNSRLSEVHAEIDALVVPSVWYENSPITIHEAYLSHTPILTSDIGGMAEFVREGIDGLQFAVGDPSSLADAMERLLDDPELLARLGSEPPPVKTIEENAAETEFRYRGLVARRRARRSRTLLDLIGTETAHREGAVEQQGADLLLLRPGASAVEYDVAIAAGARVELVVEVQALGGESGVELAGSVALDGRALGELESFRAGAADERRTFRFELDLPTDARSLRIVPSGAEGYLRLARVRLRELASDSGRASDRGVDPGSESNPQPSATRGVAS